MYLRTEGRTTYVKIVITVVGLVDQYSIAKAAGIHG